VAAILRTPPKNQTGGKEEAKEEGRGEAECVEGVEGGGVTLWGREWGVLGVTLSKRTTRRSKTKRRKRRRNKMYEAFVLRP
jgi:hypothetical protein